MPAPDEAPGVGLPGACVAAGTLGLCCGIPAAVGALVAGGGVALGDVALAGLGGLLALVGLIWWSCRRRAPRATALRAPDPVGD